MEETTGITFIEVSNAVHSLQKRGLVVCTQKDPTTLYRRINYWGEKGLPFTEEDKDKEIMEDLKRFEKAIIDILNINTDFDIHKLYIRLKLFLRGKNKCLIVFHFSCLVTYPEGYLQLIIDDMKKRGIVVENKKILTLCNFFG